VGSARPRERLALDRSISLLGHRPFVRSSVIIPYPRLASGLAIRTRRADPSEKIGLRVSPGLSPLGHPSSDYPPRGGAGSARPQRRHNANSNVASFWPPVHRQPSGGNEIPWLACGFPTRARRPRPSEETTLRAVPRFVSVKPSIFGWSPRGGAGPARPQRHHWLYLSVSPLGHRPFVYLPAVMPYRGLGTALPPGRGDRAPPRKPPFARSLGLSP